MRLAKRSDGAQEGDVASVPVHARTNELPVLEWVRGIDPAEPGAGDTWPREMVARRVDWERSRETDD